MDQTSLPASQAEKRSLRLVAGASLQQRYRVVRELGTGGMGAVYEAVDQRLDATVALKQTFSTDDRLRRQFEQEARLLAQLHHPCLPRVSDYFTEDGRAFLVMQFISGPDLAQILSQQAGPFPHQQVIAWADQLLDALIYLHERNRQIIHRDIKPHNLKLMANGRIALLDFGLAKTRGTDHSTTNSSHSIFGYTRRYSPPEQIRDLGTTPQSDIYALGATLYHLLTGVKPPDSLERAAAVANSEPDPLKRATDLNQVVDVDLSAVLNKAMALNAQDRFASAAEFREALSRVGRQDSEPQSVTALSARAPGKSASRNRSEGNFDPFDSYSILRPRQEVFNIAQKSRGPVVFGVMLAVALILLVLAYPSRVVKSFADMFDKSHVTSSNTMSDSAVLHSNKSNSVGVKASANKNVSLNAERQPQSQRKNDAPRRRSNQAAPPKPASVKPPRFSISPE